MMEEQSRKIHGEWSRKKWEQSRKIQGIHEVPSRKIHGKCEVVMPSRIVHGRQMVSMRRIHGRQLVSMD